MEVVAVVVALLAWHLFTSAIERGTILPYWVVRWRWIATVLSPRCRNMAGLDCYGFYLGLREGNASIQGRSVPTTEGWLHGQYVRVSYSPGLWRQWTIVTADPPRATGLDYVRADSWAAMTATSRERLRRLGVEDGALHIEAGRVTLSLPGLHIRNVAVLDAALEVVIAVARNSSAASAFQTMALTTLAHRVHG